VKWAIKRKSLFCPGPQSTQIWSAYLQGAFDVLEAHPALLFEDRFHSLAYFDLLPIGLFQEMGEGGEGESIARRATGRSPFLLAT